MVLIAIKIAMSVGPTLGMSDCCGLAGDYIGRRVVDIRSALKTIPPHTACSVMLQLIGLNEGTWTWRRMKSFGPLMR